MASITLENSYKSTNMDMGKSHEEAHSRQHKYLQNGEQLIETLTPNNPAEKSTDLALKMAQKVGLKTEEEWEKYNAKQRPSRQKKSYQEYVAAAAANMVKHKRARLEKISYKLKNKKTGQITKKDSLLSKSKRESIAQELAAIDRNNGIPLDGSLFYISNTQNYDTMTPDQLLKFRKFEDKVLRTFFESDTFKRLNPECIRAEIHNDELGNKHLQTQSVWYKKSGRRVFYAKGSMIKDILVEQYGSKQKLDEHLNLLCACHEEYEKKPGDQGRIGSKTPAADYFESAKYLDDPDGFPLDPDSYMGHSTKELNNRLEELWRLEQIHTLGEIATAKAKEMGIDWHLDGTYTTDGRHRTSAEYANHKETLAGPNLELVAAKASLDWTNKARQEALDTLKEGFEGLYGTTTGVTPYDATNLSEGIKQAVDKAKRQKDLDEKEANQARQEADWHRQHVQERQKQLDQLQTKLKECQQAIADVDSKKKKDIKELEHQFNGVKQKLDSAKAEKSQAETDRDNAIAEKNKAIAQKQQIDASVQQTQRQLVAFQKQRQDEEDKLKQQISDAQTKLDNLTNSYQTQKADLDSQLEQYRQDRLAQIEKAAEQEENKQKQKLREREEKLSQREKENATRKQKLDLTMAMFPAVQKYYENGEFVITSPDTKTFAQMMKTDIVKNARKARLYDKLASFTKRILKGFEKLFEQVYHRKVKNTEEDLNLVLTPSETSQTQSMKLRTEKAEQSPTKQENKFNLSKADKAYSNETAADITAMLREKTYTPGAEEYEREAQSTYTGSKEKEQSKRKDPGNRD